MNTTSCTPVRMLSMSEVTRPMIRPILDVSKKLMGIRNTWANTAARRSWITASPNSRAYRYR